MKHNRLYDLTKNIETKKPSYQSYKNHEINEGFVSHPREDTMGKLRSTIAKIEERNPQLYRLRNSLSANSLRNQHNDFRLSNLGSTHRKSSYNTLKQTLDSLQEKVLSAKEQLLPPTSMKKKNEPFLIHSKTQKDKQIPKLTTDSSITIKNSQGKSITVVTTMPKPKNFKPIYTNPYSPRRHNIYYVSQAVRAVNQKNSLALQHVSASINMIKTCQQEGIPDSSEVEKLNLKKSQFYHKKKSLILDLDQTLIHCVGNYESQVDFNLTIKIQDQSLPIGINIRPHALTFLKKMAKKFQIIIFTAGHETYANAILDVLDPDKEIFQHRLYRQHCHVLGNDQIHVKDLRIINRNLSEMVLVDNAAYSYAFQLENGIPILPFYYGSDYELVALENYLDQIDRVSDVRQLNKRTFKLHHYSKFDNGQQLIEELYMNNFQ